MASSPPPGHWRFDAAHKFMAAWVYSISSVLFSMWFLLTLTTLALFKNIFTPASTQEEKESLSYDEARLKLDLRFYVNLASMDLVAHTVETDDGFLLDLYRIVTRHPDRGEKTTGGSPDTSVKKKYPVLLIPGLMQGCGAYVTAGPQSMALSLARQGFDVWLGENRCGLSPKHRCYRPRSKKLWDWDIHDMAKRDMPAHISYVLKENGSQKLALIAHSQGTTQNFLLLSKHGIPELGESISSFTALAPAVYAGPLIDRWFLRLLRRNKTSFKLMMGQRSFLGIMTKARAILPRRVFAWVGYVVFNYMLQWSDKLWDKRFRNRNFLFAPSLVSAKHMMWWLGKGGFADTQCIFADHDGMWFDERFPALLIIAPGKDDLVRPEKLVLHMERNEKLVKVTVKEVPEYSHLDVMWAHDAFEQVIQPTIEHIWANVPDRETWISHGAAVPG